MANFNQAVSQVFKNEGRYTDEDGNPTNFGITQEYLKNVGRSCEDMKNYTQEQAKEEYRHFWTQYHYCLIDYDALATSVFTAAVNLGQSQAVKLLQRACNIINARPTL